MWPTHGGSGGWLGASRRHVTSGRTLPDHSRPVSVSLASRRPRWRGHRHPAPASTGSARRRAVLSQVAQAKRSSPAPPRHRPSGAYRAAHRIIMPSVVHDTTRYVNNRAEVSQARAPHRRFKSVAQAQRFLAVHDAVRNLFTIGRHQLPAGHQRLLRWRASVAWNTAAAARRVRHRENATRGLWSTLT